MSQTIDSLSQQEAKRIVRDIGASGLPPSKGVAYYNVGNDSLLQVLEEEYFKDFLVDGGGSFKLVVGDYGAGKSHFLLCIRDRAWKHGFVVSRTDLSPKECPYDDQLQVYRSVARNIIWHNEDVTIEDDLGLDLFLENHFNRMCAKQGVDEVFDGKRVEPRVRFWIDRLLEARVESRSFKHAIHGFFEALARGDGEHKATLGAYLLGEPMAAKHTQAFNVNEKIDKTNAFRMLRSLCQIIHELGFAGTLLLFDEGERMVSIGSSKQEKIACDNLREVIDRCVEGKLPGAMFVYAVHPGFVNDIAPKYQALSQRIGKMSEMFSRRNPQSTIISLQDLDLPGTELLRQIGLKLLAIYEVAHEVGFNTQLQRENINMIAEQCAALLSDNHRREFVKTLIGFFNEQRSEGERRYDEEQAIAAIRKNI